MSPWRHNGSLGIYLVGTDTGRGMRRLTSRRDRRHDDRLGRDGSIRARLDMGGRRSRGRFVIRNHIDYDTKDQR
jgi:hypothetical protein